VHLGTYGYVLSCLALNDTACGGSGSSGAYPVLENPQAWLQGVRLCADLGYQEELQRAGSVTPTFCKNKNFVQIGAHIEL
jgi:hypothetical protein